MEKVKTRSLKAEFSAAVAVTLLAILLISALTVWGCWTVRRRILPEPNKVALIIEETSADREHRSSHIELTLDGSAEPVVWMSNEMTKPDIIDEPGLLVGEANFSVERIEASVSQLDPGERAAYTAAGVLMGALPAAYAILGVLFCALWFYRKRLAPAITVLNEATRHISEQDLDFTVECPVNNNELGRLCGSFEKMRQALYDNNLKLWRSIEERRTMQASVAHDLRNPLAILEGTVEHIRALAPTGELTGERLEAAMEIVAVTAKRMERYTDYIRDLSAIEDTDITVTEAVLPDFLREAAEGVRVLAEPKNLTVSDSYDVPEGVIELDREIFYRTLENVFSNAVRYAESRIELAFELRRETLLARVSDDGPGFSEQMLRKKASLYYSEDLTGEHMGLGLATSKILCELHGGGLRIMNRPGGGAVVEIRMAVKRI